MLDIHLTKNWGVLENLLHGGLYLADIGDVMIMKVQVCCVQRSKWQPGLETIKSATVDTSRQLNRVHIHVERAIGAV